MASPRDPKVIAAANRINERPLPSVRLNYVVERGCWVGKTLHPAGSDLQLHEMFEQAKSIEYSPERILRLAKEREE